MATLPRTVAVELLTAAIVPILFRATTEVKEVALVVIMGAGDEFGAATLAGGRPKSVRHLLS